MRSRNLDDIPGSENRAAVRESISFGPEGCVANMLAPETWRQILREAVYVRGQLETRWDIHPDDSDWRGWDPADRSSLRTKLAIVLVSKGWKEMGDELLYEHLFLSKELILDETDSGILRRLESSSEGGIDGASRMPLGWWTKRVDVDVTASQGVDTQQFLRFFSSCYNIRTVSFFARPTRSHHLFNILPISSLLEKRFSHSLKHLHFNLACMQRELVLPNLDLDSLQLGIDGVCDTFNDLPPETANISSLSLHFHFNLYSLPSWRFHNLRHLSVTWLSEEELPALELFLSSNGSTLSSIHLHFYQHCEALRSLPRYTPNLLSLALEGAFALGEMKFEDFQMKTLVYLSLKVTDDENHTAIDFAPHLEELLNSKAFPKLQRIRVWGHVQEHDLGVYLEWREAAKACASHHVRLEYDTGELV